MKIKIYTTSIAGKTLGFNSRAIQRYCRIGKIKGVKIGGQWFINPENLIGFQRGKPGRKKKKGGKNAKIKN